MKSYDFGPSYGIGEWVKVTSRGWAEVLSSHWDGTGWRYTVKFEENDVLEIPENLILF